MLKITDDIAAIVRGIIAHPDEIVRRYALADAVEEIGEEYAVQHADAVRNNSLPWIELTGDNTTMFLDETNRGLDLTISVAAGHYGRIKPCNVMFMFPDSTLWILPASMVKKWDSTLTERGYSHAIRAHFADWN